MFSVARTYRIAILLLSSVAFGATGLVAQTGWKVGLAAVKITPDKPIRMAGYGSRDRPSEGIDADLFAKALALEDSDGNRALLITADLLGFTREIAEAIGRGEFRIPTRPAMAYMMSSGQILVSDEGQNVGAWRPHLMLYVPYITAEQLGLYGEISLEAAAVFNEGEPTAHIVVVVKEFVDP